MLGIEVQDKIKDRGTTLEAYFAHRTPISAKIEIVPIFLRGSENEKMRKGKSGVYRDRGHRMKKNDRNDKKHEISSESTRLALAK